MATRAYIGTAIALSDDVIKFVYIHHGHPSDMGGYLNTVYCSTPKVSGLISGGDISSFGEDGCDGEPDYYRFKDGEEWDDVKYKYIGSRKELADEAGEADIDYVYVWDGEAWQVACVRGFGDSHFDFMPLEDAMKMIAADTDGRW